MKEERKYIGGQKDLLDKDKDALLEHIDYCNNTKITLTSISDCCGGVEYQLSGALTLIAYNTTDFIGGSGGGIQFST